jgi:hypothetical protein
MSKQAQHAADRHKQAQHAQPVINRSQTPHFDTQDPIAGTVRHLAAR